MFNVLVNCMGVDVPNILPNIVSLAVGIIQVVVPILLIVMGMLDLGKAVAASKEEEIKKAQTLFIKRIVAAVLVFFIVAIVQLVFGLLADADSSDGSIDKEGITECMDLFLNGTKSR